MRQPFGGPGFTGGGSGGSGDSDSDSDDDDDPGGGGGGRNTGGGGTGVGGGGSSGGGGDDDDDDGDDDGGSSGGGGGGGGRIIPTPGGGGGSDPGGGGGGRNTGGGSTGVEEIIPPDPTQPEPPDISNQEIKSEITDTVADSDEGLRQNDVSVDVSGDQLDIETEQTQTLEGDVVRDRLRDQVASQSPIIDRDEVEVERSNDGFVARGRTGTREFESEISLDTVADQIPDSAEGSQVVFSDGDFEVTTQQRRSLDVSDAVTVGEGQAQLQESSSGQGFDVVSDEDTGSSNSDIGLIQTPGVSQPEVAVSDSDLETTAERSDESPSLANPEVDEGVVTSVSENRGQGLLSDSQEQGLENFSENVTQPAAEGFGRTFAPGEDNQNVILDDALLLRERGREQDAERVEQAVGDFSRGASSSLQSIIDFPSAVLGAETAVEVGQALPQAADDTSREAVAATGAAVGATVAGSAVQSARENPVQTAGGLFGDAAVGFGASKILGRAGQITKDRTRTFNTEDITADVVNEDTRAVFDGENDDQDDRFPGFEDEDLARRDQPEAIRQQAEQNTPQSVEEQFEDAGVVGEADLKKALDVSPDAPDRGGFATQEGNFESPGASFGPEVSPNFFRIESGSTSLRPGLPDTGGSPTAVIARTDVEAPEADNLDDFNEELLDRQGETDAVTIPERAASIDEPGEAEAIVPPGAEFRSISDSVATRLGLGADFRVEFGGRRIPVRAVAPDGDSDRSDIVESFSRSGRSLDSISERVGRRTDRPAPVATFGSGSRASDSDSSRRGSDRDSRRGSAASSSSVFGPSSSSVFGPSSTSVFGPNSSGSPSGSSGSPSASSGSPSGSSGSPSGSSGSPSGSSASPSGASPGAAGSGSGPSTATPGFDFELPDDEDEERERFEEGPEDIEQVLTLDTDRLDGILTEEDL